VEELEEFEKQFENILTPDKQEKRRLIAILQEVQQRLGYLPKEAMLRIAAFLDIPPSAVYSVATFYNQFRFVPPGKHQVSVCMGTACHMAGGKLVLEGMARELDIEVGGVTDDREFSLERVACIGCCALAPVVTVGDRIFTRVKPPQVEEVLFLAKKAGTSTPEEKRDGT
jgi:NADH-quinone oxidoreductase subunit E